MDFNDELPCGGYEQEDRKIESNLQKLSLEAEGVIANGCGKMQCGQGECGTEQCCQVNACQVAPKVQEVVLKPKRKVECKKCKENPAVLVHKNQQICKQCLLKNIEYKTRLTLQNKMHVKPKSRLLLCFSGGLNSICLVQIMANIKKRYQKSPLFGQLLCLHIQQQQKLPDGYADTFQKITNIKLHVIPVWNAYQDEQHRNLGTVTNLFKSFRKNSNTVDLLVLLRNRLILDFAKQNNIDMVLSGKNGESLAAEIFKYFTKGIGGCAPQLCSGQPSLFEYPLRQHLQKQLQYYFYNEKLSSLSMIAQPDDLSHIACNQVDTYLDQFIATLQDRYSHTAPAIVRTGQKLKSNMSEAAQCKWCWLTHDRADGLCQKCNRLREFIKDEDTWKLMPQFMHL